MNDKDFMRLEGKIDLMMRHLGVTAGSGRSAPTGGSAPASTGTIASDSDLDGEHGDQLVKKDPARYNGPKMAPRKMSHGSAGWLDAVAELNDWRAGKTEEEGKDSKWARLDAARARGWAARIRAGHKPPAVAEDPEWVTNNDGFDAGEADAEAWHSAHD